MFLMTVLMVSVKTAVGDEVAQNLEWNLERTCRARVNGALRGAKLSPSPLRWKGFGLMGLADDEPLRNSMPS
jgi:hypothetical protein